MEWDNLKNKVCSFDVESDEHGDIFAIGAVYQDRVFHCKGPFEIQKVLKDFDAFAQDADFLLGHNIIVHDMPLCYALNPKLGLHNKPLIDTLFLSPLAFPENPYHRLVKNYKLLRDSLNDPLADARQALSLFQDQWVALQEQHVESGVLSFYYYTFSGDLKFKGLQDILLIMGGQPVQASAAFDLFKAITKNRVCNTHFSKVVLSYLPNPQLRSALAYCLA